MNMLTAIQIEDDVLLRSPSVIGVAERAKAKVVDARRVAQIARLKDFRRKFAALPDANVELWTILCHECGTVGCLAGWAIQLYDTDRSNTERHFVGTAFRQYRQCELLDISKLFAWQLGLWCPAHACAFDDMTSKHTDRVHGLNRLDKLIGLAKRGRLPFCTEPEGVIYA